MAKDSRNQDYVKWFRDLRMSDLATVGGKNSSLGEMISQLAQVGVRVPDGFATTAFAYREFLEQGGLGQKIDQRLKALDVNNIGELLSCGKEIRSWIIETPLQPRLKDEIAACFAKLCEGATGDVSVAVRSSATAEDLPEASFAGQQETFLNIRGLDNVYGAVKMVFASLYQDRAIAYRVHNSFEHDQVLLSAGVQRMVRTDSGASGVAFTLDTESGFDKVVFITSAYGLGELLVQGSVNPDEFYVYKPALEQNRPAIVRRQLGAKAIKMVYSDSKEVGKTVMNVDVPQDQRLKFSLSDRDVEELARYALLIEKHYQRPMDIEWGKDGLDGKLYILQARPETVRSQTKGSVQERYRLKSKSEVLISGRAIGQKIGAGEVRNIPSPKEIDRVRPGDILVTDMTDPDWEPVMKRAAAIVTNRGGRTCHAAIIARELGIPAIVGCGDATKKLKDGISATVSCAEGDTGCVYSGILDIEISRLDIADLPKTPVKLCLNVGSPDRAFDFQKLPNAGVGLARIEFVIARMIGVHPRAVLDYPNIPSDVKKSVEERSAAYGSPVNFYVEKLAEGIATLGAAFYPKPVIVRLSDFKTNEYSGLIGGEHFEAKEENPMIGFRGASRYIADSFRDCFELECRAVKKVRDGIGLTNVEVMIPFVRTLEEASKVIELLEKNGLKRGQNGLRIIMMCEIPSNAVLAEEFLQYFDGYSIGSNDMTQLTLGLDRDSGVVAGSFDERDPAVKAMLHMAIQACRKNKKYIGICGQGPSDHPEFAQWLVKEGIDAISLNPDSVVDTWLYLAELAKG